MTTPDGSVAGDSMSPTVGAGEPAGSGAPAGITEENLAELVAAAADEAGVDIAEIQVASAERVTWPDGSLGCPRAGMGYTQALVPGFRVVLLIDGEEHHFHAAEGGEFAFCEDPQPPVEGAES